MAGGAETSHIAAPTAIVWQRSAMRFKAGIKAEKPYLPAG
jgi:hypothetical protein